MDHVLREVQSLKILLNPLIPSNFGSTSTPPPLHLEGFNHSNLDSWVSITLTWIKRTCLYLIFSIRTKLRPKMCNVFVKLQFLR
ncbi:hypothetical protein Hanom_Chr03g00214271 [Helianthus anomalus]